MRYLVLGCGAIGGTVAAGLARDGHHVIVCDADPDVVAAIRAHGLRITGPTWEFSVPVAAAIGPGELPERIDGPVLIAVKAHHTKAAAAALAGRLQDDGYVVSLQNGLNAAVLADVLGPERVVEACVNFGADVLAPGLVLRGNHATFVIGELDGTISSRVSALVADIADAKATDRVLGYLWSKEAYGAMLVATAVSDLPIADVLDNPAYRALLIELARQVLAQAPVQPVPLDGFDPADLPGSLRRLAAFNRASAKTRSGIYQDLAVRRRPTEVRAILGGLDGVLIRRVTELIESIERGERMCCRSNLDLLAAHERLERLGRPLNAVVSAIGAPRRAHTGALAGRPVAVKDIIAVTGVPTGCGSPASDPRPATRDASLVGRLRAAGAEVFSTTQCLEYAAGFAHPEVGGTLNPRDPSRTSGGSSGGSAALVAAGVCDLAVGTDTGGSIRIPAAYCGVVGLKPSYGLVPVGGVFPLSPQCDHAGTLTATVAGTAELLAVLAQTAGGPAEHGRPDGFTIGVLRAQLDDPSVTDEVRRAVTAALADLTGAGLRLVDVDAPWLAELPRWEGSLAVIVAREAYLVHAGRDTSGYCDGTRALLRFGESVTSQMLSRALAEQAELTAGVQASLAGVDALAGPTVGYPAPDEDPPFGVGESNAECRFTGPYNLTGHPALSLPVPAPALPVGLQLAGHTGADFTLLAVAAAVERALSGHPAERQPRRN